MAPRRARHHPPSRRHGGAGRRRRSRTRRSISCRPSSALARPIGTPRRAAPSSGSPAAPARPSLPAPRSSRSCYQTRDLIEAMRSDWQAAGRRRRCSASMAAWSPPTGRMQFLADILDAPGRPAEDPGDHGARRRLSRRARRRALPAARRNSPRAGSASGASRRRWTRLRAGRKFAGWRDAVSRALSRGK